MTLRSGSEAIPFPVLIGDIGGTNARFALLAAPDAPPQIFPAARTGDFPDIGAAIARTVLDHTATRPRTAIIDMAGPVTGDAIPLTNADWVLRPREMIRSAGLDAVIILNDFEALALALPELGDGDVEQIGGGPGEPSGSKAVLGPGTGLGVGALLQADGLTVPAPGEGGHVALGPAEADEFPIWLAAEREHGRMSAEAFLCGRGLVRLYRAVALTEGGAATLSDPAAVTEAALGGADPLAARTLSLWCRLLGRLAGDMALTFMARGGVYLGGGIAPRILPFLREIPPGGAFRPAFEAKAPHAELMRKIPTWVITRENPALLGLAAFANAPDRFGVRLEGRRWRRG